MPPADFKNLFSSNFPKLFEQKEGTALKLDKLEKSMNAFFKTVLDNEESLIKERQELEL